MSMMVSFVLSFFPRDVLDEILKLIESVSEDFPSYSFYADREFQTREQTDIAEHSIKPSFRLYSFTRCLGFLGLHLRPMIDYFSYLLLNKSYHFLKVFTTYDGKLRTLEFFVTAHK